MTNKQNPTDLSMQSLTQALGLSFGLLKVLMVVISICYLSSGVFSVNSFETGLVFRYGKLVRIKDSGLCFAWPSPIERVEKIETNRVQTIEIKSFLPKKSLVAGTNVNAQTLNPEYDGYAITGDANIVHSEITLHYKIKDVRKNYARFHHNNKELVSSLCKAAFTRTISEMNIDDVLRFKIAHFKDTLEARLRVLLDTYQSGIALEQINLQMSVPLQVIDAFNQVLQAEQEVSKHVNIAKGGAQRLENETIGQTAKILGKAKQFKSEYLNRLQADAKYIQTIKEKYKNNPKGLEIFLADTKYRRIQKIIKEAKTKFILPYGSKDELRLHLSKNKETLLGGPEMTR